MKVALCGDVLRVSELEELGAANSDLFRRQVRAVRPGPSLKALEIDLSKTQFVDSCGLGALVAVQKWASSQSGNGPVTVRLLNPPPPVQQILELTRLHRTFEIVID